MARPAVGTAVREGTRRGVVVRHAGAGSMVDVQFTDVGFVERRDAGRLAVVPAGAKRAATEPDWADDHKRATVEAVYERLVLEHLGKKAFRNAKGQRIDVLALNKGDLTREEVNNLVSRAFAIATRTGQVHGDVVEGGAGATPSGRALSALRRGADPRLVERQMKAGGASGEAIERAIRLTRGKSPADAAQRLVDYEETLALRRKTNPRGGRGRPPLRRNFLGAALRAGGAAIEAGTAAFRGAAKVAPTVAREAGALAQEGRALAETGTAAARESFRAFLKTPQGKAFAAQITTTVTALFGAEVARRAHLTPEQTALVQRAVSRKTGEKLDPEMVAAALHSSKRK